jgi:tRNA-modifying protein YgfZ
MSEMHVYHCLSRPAAVLRATGPDAFQFLQSQFSNDLKVEGVEHPVSYGLWLDHKGKIQADSFVIQKSPQEFLLLSYDCPAALLRGHLESHLIADEVELRDETGPLALLHVWAEHYEESFAGLIEDLARAAGAESWMGRRPTPYSSWDILAPAAVLENIVCDLEAEGVEAAPAQALLAARLLSGVPAVPADAGPGDLPQEAGLEREGVSFDKGCYAGQEIMSRLHTQGHVNRALWLVEWNVQTTRPSDDLPVPLYAGAEVVGELRSRVFSEVGGLGLAMLKTRALAGQSALGFRPSGPTPVRLLRNLTEA